MILMSTTTKTSIVNIHLWHEQVWHMLTIITVYPAIHMYPQMRVLNPQLQSINALQALFLIL